MAEDRNKAVKQQLLKKRDEAARRKVALLPSEMVDDALARGSEGLVRWLRRNFGLLQWVIIAVVLGGIGYGVYDHFADKRAETASAELAKALVIERGRIVSSGSAAKSSEDDGARDTSPIFKSADERRDTALASYRKVTSTYPGTGAAILARLGEAGLLLDKRDFDGALQAYREVQASPLANADVSVKGRALEGIGLALEGKHDVEGALKAFRELENTDARGLRELGMYQQARILFDRGDLDKAKELLKTARERLKSAAGDNATRSPFGEGHPFAFLESQVEDLLRRIDPSLLVSASQPPTNPTMGPDLSKMSPENLKRLQEQLQRSLENDKQSAPTAPASSGSP